MKPESVKNIDDISKFAMLNQGNTAEIYSYGDGKILKLFRDSMPFSLINKEYECGKAINAKLKNTPKVFDMVSYKSRYGIVCERITGGDMIGAMLGKIYKIRKYSRELAFLHSEIHNAQVDLPQNVKETLRENIDFADLLTDSEKENIKSYISTLPDKNSLCHFDFHPGNVMIRDGALCVIDWMTACKGDASADAARTVLLLRYGEMKYGNPFLKAAVRIFKRYIGNIYFREYKKLTGITEYDTERWILPIAAARLSEWITDGEKEKLLKLIKEKLRYTENPKNISK